jgi:hypothetical protein
MTIASTFIAALIATAAIPPPAAPVSAPAAAPVPSASERPLKEIGHVQSSAVCGNIVVHANSAISSALRNDSTLALTVNRLRNLDFVSNNLTLEQGIHELDRLAGELHDDSVHGDGEVKRLRDMADKSTDPTRKAELHAFADALGGALARQKKVAMDLNGLVAYMQYREMATPDETEAKFAAADSNDTAFQNAPFRPAFMGGGQRAESLNEIAANAADDFTGRMPLIAADEVKASDHAEGAVTGC